MSHIHPRKPRNHIDMRTTSIDVLSVNDWRILSIPPQFAASPPRKIRRSDLPRRASGESATLDFTHPTMSTLTPSSLSLPARFWHSLLAFVGELKHGSANRPLHGPSGRLVFDCGHGCACSDLPICERCADATPRQFHVTFVDLSLCTACVGCPEAGASVQLMAGARINGTYVLARNGSCAGRRSRPMCRARGRCMPPPIARAIRRRSRLRFSGFGSTPRSFGCRSRMTVIRYCSLTRRSIPRPVVPALPWPTP